MMMLKYKVEMQKKRIKHNDLTHYFLRPHDQLPRAYLASCEKFFKELSTKRQAPSFKQQATSNPAGLQELDPTVDWNKLIDTLKTE